MTIEQELFSSYRVIKDRLLEYGFFNYSNIYTYSTIFHNNEFKALISVDESGTLTGKVIEMAFNEEFSQLRNDSFHGGFIGEVREQYKEILIDIRNKCFKEVIFASNQANRIIGLINEKYHESPDFPFKQDRYKKYGVIRYKGNNKWYGLIMNINKSVFGGDNKEEYVDVINVRIDEKERDNIINNKNIFPSYHMNKQKWISILLDESLNDGEVMKYINFSRDYMIKKRSK